jgi:hypothetical protein
MTNAMTELFGEVIHTYTREQAIEDGVLVDVTEAGREVGFQFPVAMTQAAWLDTVKWSEADEKRKPEYTGQDERGRLHDVVWMAMLAARRAPAGTRRIPVRLLRVPTVGRGVRPRYADLVMECGPGDNAEPVLTIMMPDED